MDEKTQGALEGLSATVSLFLQGDTDTRATESSPEPGIETLRTRLNALLDQASGDAENFHKINMSMADVLTDWYQTLKEVRGGNLNARVPAGEGDEFLDRMSEELNGTLATLQELQVESERRRIALIEQQSKIIEELSTPIIQVWDGVLALPVIGIVDSARAQEMMEKLLDRVVESQTRCVILDLTGVTVIDTKTADYLIKMVKAATLVGANCTVTGIGPTVAQTITRMGLDLQGVVTLRDLRDGLKRAFSDLGFEVRQKER